MQDNKKLFHKKKLNKNQMKACLSAINTPFSLIQGPPGTGKTHVIAQLVKEIN